MATWEILIQRQSQQSDGSRIRTVGTYQVLHDGIAVAELQGTTAESPGPGENDRPASVEDPRRILPGRYPLATHIGPHYATIGYRDDPIHPLPLMPALQLLGTDARTDILIHPGKYEFLSSIGCINPCSALPNSSQIIDYPESRARVIALIDDLRVASGPTFPNANNEQIPDAWVVIEGEPGE